MAVSRQRKFNIAGSCNSQLHYMVDTSREIDETVHDYIDQGEYFAINRARQFGKTTMLNLLRLRLNKAYLVIDLSFEGKSAYFESEERFSKGIQDDVSFVLATEDPSLTPLWSEPMEERASISAIGQKVAQLCKASSKPVILMIDEVDQATNYEVFTAFLGMLRGKYLDRNNKGTPTFHSVILAGVHDIKNLKAKIRPNSEHAYNSPWNIAVPYTVDLSFSASQIATMLNQYEEDHHTGMDSNAVAERLYYLTSGYPWLVSRLCKYIADESLEWTTVGVDAAIDLLLQDDNTLFDDMIKNVNNNHSFKDLLESILLRGIEFSFQRSNPQIQLGVMFGVLKEQDGKAVISNSIFETYLYNHFASLQETRGLTGAFLGERSAYITNNTLDLTKVMEKFADFMYSEYRDEDGAFIERQARLLFLSFLKPIINGSGHYAVEPETRDSRRMDIQVFYGKQEYILELKIWRGEQAAQDAYDQLATYLKSRNQTQGYLLSFAHNKAAPRHKQPRTFSHNNCTITEVVITYRDKD